MRSTFRVMVYLLALAVWCNGTANAQCYSKSRVHVRAPSGRPAPYFRHAGPEVPPDPPDPEFFERPADWHFGKTVQIPILRQISIASDWRNDCGQYLIAAFLATLGQEIDSAKYDEIGRAVNPNQTGVAHSTMVEYLSQWVEASNARLTFTDLRRQIDLGLPTILAVQTGGAGHLLMVTGYTAYGNGDVHSWKVVDNGVLNGDVEHRKLKPMWDEKANYAIKIETRGTYPCDLDARLITNVRRVASTPVQPRRPDVVQVKTPPVIDSIPKPPPPIVHPIPNPPPPVSAVSSVTRAEVAPVTSERTQHHLRVERKESPAVKGPMEDLLAKPRRASPRLEDLMPPGSFMRVIFGIMVVTIPLGLAFQIARRHATCT